MKETTDAKIKCVPTKHFHFHPIITKAEKQPLFQPLFFLSGVEMKVTSK